MAFMCDIFQNNNFPEAVIRQSSILFVIQCMSIFKSLCLVHEKTPCPLILLLSLQCMSCSSIMDASCSVLSCNNLYCFSAAHIVVIVVMICMRMIGLLPSAACSMQTTAMPELCSSYCKAGWTVVIPGLHVIQNLD